jgi:hypothetical protein
MKNLMVNSGNCQLGDQRLNQDTVTRAHTGNVIGNSTDESPFVFNLLQHLIVFSVSKYHFYGQHCEFKEIPRRNHPKSNLDRVESVV